MAKGKYIVERSHYATSTYEVLAYEISERHAVEILEDLYQHCVGDERPLVLVGNLQTAARVLYLPEEDFFSFSTEEWLYVARQMRSTDYETVEYFLSDFYKKYEICK